MQLRYVTPVYLCVYFGILIYCFGSSKGREAYFFLRRLVNCWTQERYRQELANELQERAQQTLRLSQTRHRRRQESTSGRQNTQAIEATLKTRILKVPSSPSADDDDDTNATDLGECMICLADLQPNDRVGHLHCGHVYHVDPCLKEWLRRKNHCPLCHASDIAQPVATAATATATATAPAPAEEEDSSVI
jgi:hypothetical protein